MLLALRSLAEAPPVITTFDVAKIADGGVFASLSNGNLTATGINGTSGDFGNVGATSSKSSGKVTYSFTFDSAAAGADTAFGFGDPSFNWTGIVQFSGTAHAASWRVYGNGTSAETFYNGTTFVDLTTINGGGWSGARGGVGHEHQILIDIDNLLVYLAIDGVPVFGMNPASGTGGISIAISAPFTPGLSHGDANVATLKPTPSYVPAGFSAWDAASSGTAYNDNLSETAAAADTEAATQTFVNAQTENTTPGDVYAVANVMAGSLNEAAAAADALATAVTFASADAESAVAADSLNPAGSTFGVPLSESAAAADALGVGLVMPVSASESVAAGDTVTSAQTFASTLGESAAAADSLSGGLLIAKSLNETAAAGDAATVTVTFGPAVSESATAGEAEASQAVMPNALGESAGAGDSAASAQVFAESLGESAAAGDSVSAGATTYNEAVNENLTALASLGVGLVLPAAVAESSTAADAEAAAAVLAASLGEAATANDNVVGTVTSIYPPGPVDSARIGAVARRGGIAAIAASSRSAAVAAIRRNGSVAAGARVGKVNRASGNGRVG